MSVRYPILLRRITLDSTNNAISMTENAVTQTVSIAAGTYWLDPNVGEASDAADADVGGSLLAALVTALNSHTGGTNTYQATIAWSADPTAPQAVITISRATGSNAFALLFAAAATTFDSTMIGFPEVDTTNDTSAKVSTIDPNAAWASDQPHRGIEPEVEHEYAVTRSVSGMRRALHLGGPYKTRVLDLQFISEERMHKANGNGGIGQTNDASLMAFVNRCAANGRFLIYLVPISGLVLESPSASDSVDVDGSAPCPFVFDEGIVQEFRATRHSPGVALYAIALRCLRVRV